MYLPWERPWLFAITVALIIGWKRLKIEIRWPHIVILAGLSTYGVTQAEDYGLTKGQAIAGVGVLLVYLCMFMFWDLDDLRKERDELKKERDDLRKELEQLEGSEK